MPIEFTIRFYPCIKSHNTINKKGDWWQKAKRCNNAPKNMIPIYNCFKFCKACVHASIITSTHVVFAKLYSPATISIRIQQNLSSRKNNNERNKELNGTIIIWLMILSILYGHAIASVKIYGKLCLQVRIVNQNDFVHPKQFNSIRRLCVENWDESFLL